MSADEMRKLMEAMDDNYETVAELTELYEQMSEAISQFDRVLRKAVGYDGLTYQRFKSYPGGHIMAALGIGGYGSNDTTLVDIIQELENEE